MKKQVKILIAAFVMVMLFGMNLKSINALPYCDIRFEKTSEEIVRGEYEILGGEINLKDEEEVIMLIRKSYESNINKSITKDEEDAIGHVCGMGWQERVEIAKEEMVQVDQNTNTYVYTRPVYKEIKGQIVEDYGSWNKKKEITLQIPIDVEYKIEDNSSEQLNKETE